MNILIFNAGSASLKFEVFAKPELPSISDKQRKVYMVLKEEYDRLLGIRSSVVTGQ
jgi:acetate kinase